MEYRLHWVPNGFLLCWPCTFQVFCVDFIHAWWPTQTQFPVEYGLKSPQTHGNHFDIILIILFSTICAIFFLLLLMKNINNCSECINKLSDFQIGNLCPTSVVYWDGLSEMADTILCSTTKESNMTKPSLLHREHNQKRSYREIVSGESY